MLKQQKDTSDSFLHALEKIEVRISGANPAAAIHSIFDSLCRRIDRFNFDAENGRTFDIRYKRFKDVFDNDCTELSEQVPSIRCRISGSRVRKLQNTAAEEVGSRRRCHNQRPHRRVPTHQVVQGRCKNAGECHKPQHSRQLHHCRNKSVEIVAEPAAPCREEIVAKLKVNHADVFKTGLGRCTKTKATLRLKPDAHPVFRELCLMPTSPLSMKRSTASCRTSAFPGRLLCLGSPDRRRQEVKWNTTPLCRLFYWIE
uniref:HTH OST-type domain-containing protein n=1 Tax=Haemonchus placei TaxID=6290 RepID=A0A0N4WMS7_HAEPC